MKKSLELLCVILILGSILISCNQDKTNDPENESKFTKLSGAYLGQKPPGLTPEIFAKNIISSPFNDNGTPTFSPDMNEVYWSVTYVRGTPEVILYKKKINNEWTEAQVADFSGQYNDGSPFLSPDNSKLFFHSNRPINGKGEPKDFDIWYVNRTKDGWSEPINAGKNVNTEKREWYPTISKKGTLYFTSFHEGYVYDIGIFKSNMIENTFSERMVLGEKINSKKGYNFCAFIEPNEEFLLLCSGRDGQEFDDLYCSFKNEDNSWSDPIIFNPSINAESNERSPRISADGRYMFFTRIRNIDKKTYYEVPQSLKDLNNNYCTMDNYDIYWVDAKIIDDLKPQHLK
ncbi:PD40 domain-containing protein [Lentimicrobium sp. S6]|uniref:TolB family protein n=1 Tax=Lentimicrobium sp. S6 TaxID=2735872 RepID=UPI001554DBD5|nr:PD40 domain-containing protein [Lentimicrobium sp. S6]NPD47283.1 hypothetical protein [Lentimicrobium sp. S6]